MIHRTRATERNFRPWFSVNPRQAGEVFRAAFDAFCLRWNLYGMQNDEPLLLKLAVNITRNGDPHPVLLVFRPKARHPLGRHLRRAFNSPFWPHVPATTSLGQEGLAFHVWCRHLLHWDLSHSPLNLEQREGRIQRFGGLSTRTVLAKQLRAAVLADNTVRKSPWQTLAEMAETASMSDSSGLSPWWGCDSEAIERHIVKLHHSKHVLRLNELSQQRLLYRLALGQPHQQDFIESVSKLPPDGRDQFALRLSAWRAK